jgi:hypothetical protein
MCQAGGSHGDKYEYRILIRNVGQYRDIIPTFPLILAAFVT